jgi:ABC-type amino acid transport substrate-binding protein
VPKPTRADSLLVDEAIYRYLWRLEHDEDGDLLPDGSLSSHFDKAKWRLRPLSAAFGATLVEHFSAANLKALRKLMRSGQWKEDTASWSHSYCNSATANVRRFFAWLESEGLVSPGSLYLS